MFTKYGIPAKLCTQQRRFDVSKIPPHFFLILGMSWEFEAYANNLHAKV